MSKVYVILDSEKKFVSIKNTRELAEKECEEKSKHYMLSKLLSCEVAKNAWEIFSEEPTYWNLYCGKLDYDKICEILSSFNEIPKKERWEEFDRPYTYIESVIMEEKKKK